MSHYQATRPLEERGQRRIRRKLDHASTPVSSNPSTSSQQVARRFAPLVNGGFDGLPRQGARDLDEGRKLQRKRQQVSSTDTATSSASSSRNGSASTNRVHPTVTSSSSTSRGASSSKTKGGASSTTSAVNAVATPKGSGSNTVEAKTGPGLLNVTLPPEGFMQCAHVVLPLAVAPDAPVVITVIDFHDAQQRLEVELPPPVTNFDWNPIDFPAQTVFQLEITASPNDSQSPSFASYTRRDVVRLGKNNTSCLTQADIDSVNELGDGSGRHHHRQSHNTIAVVAGVLGGVLLILICLIIYISVRRRKEGGDGSSTRNSDAGHSHRSHGGAGAVRRAMGYGRAFLTTPRHGRRTPTEMREVDALTREEEEEEEERAGLGYMTSLVPGLDANEHVAEPGGLRGSHDLLRQTPAPGDAAHGHRARGGSTALARERGSKEIDLPSYKQSQKEAKALPRYSLRAGEEPTTGTRRPVSLPQLPYTIRPDLDRRPGDQTPPLPPSPPFPAAGNA